MNELTYTITPNDLAGHHFLVELQIEQPNPKGQRLSLPSWIPGSYLIRDFARNIESIEAYAANKSLLITKTDNNTWQLEACTEPVTIRYTVYAWDLSVRSAHLDETHGFFNGTSVFLQVHGHEEKTCLLDIKPPKNIKNWKVYTSLPEAKEHRKAASRHGFGMYRAPNYDALIDHPVEMGTPQVISFTVCGATHEMVFTGQIPNLDLKRIAADTAKICEYQIRFFEPDTQRAPFLDSSDRYVFMTMVTGKDYGGLEHRASTALMASRNDLPTLGNPEQSDQYRTFLGLVSHEYFHTWNVKRIKPKAFAPYNFYAENHTSLLWIFEGFTSYYDDLSLFRAGLISHEQYLSLLAKNIANVHAAPGRFKQSAAQSSFDAWTKFYKQDENAPNAIVSYYSKGSLIALGLDLTIRKATNNTKSLDDVMRLLWQRYGRDFFSKRPNGLEENGFNAIALKATGVDVSDFTAKYAYGTEDIPLAGLLAFQNLKLGWKTGSELPSLNIRTRISDNACQIASVIEHGAAHLAGLSAGDTLLALDGIRVEANNLNTLLKRYQPGQTVAVHVFRRDELRQFNVTLSEPVQNECVLAPAQTEENSVGMV
ncbi:MAG: M61 family metallopeptidase [Alcaligenaceae bacterium]|nr:M61 family metallopeptidase [Alcaligenaceae bacterium]